MRNQVDSGHDPIQERRREQVITERDAKVPTFLLVRPHAVKRY